MGFFARLIIAIAAAGFFAAALAVWLGAPGDRESLAPLKHTADLQNGKLLFIVGGCLSCHAPDKSSGIDAGFPAGGAPLKTPLGAFYPPNITPDSETGIGAWSDADFIIAMRDGVSPGKRHYFPSFPYTSYRNMRLADLLDLKAYLFTLTAVRKPRTAHDIPFEPLARAFVGVWKWAGLGTPALAVDRAQSVEWNRGAYLVQGPGHCGECHTPRNLFMVWRRARGAFLAGGTHPEGKGKVPSLRGLIKRKRFKDTGDLTFALRFGETMGYEDMSSGGMGKIQSNLEMLPEADVHAIAVFLSSLE